MTLGSQASLDPLAEKENQEALEASDSQAVLVSKVMWISVLALVRNIPPKHFCVSLKRQTDEVKVYISSFQANEVRPASVAVPVLRVSPVTLVTMESKERRDLQVGGLHS